MRNNIPMELRALPQWVVAGPNKIPLNPRTGQAASVTDPSTWATFEEAVRFGAKHLGFVLTENDPYTGIDIDDKKEDPASEEQLQRQYKVLAAFDSYTERSAGERWYDEHGRERGGYHILVRGKVPFGSDRDHIGVYSTARHLICTGDVVRDTPISDYQELLDILYAEMTPPAATIELHDRQGVMEDMEVIEMAMRAANGDKFNELCGGDWEAMGYGSQSEADFALLSILAYYTLDNEQVRRLFRMSKLGQREKAQKNDRYLDFALSKIRAKQPPLVDFEALASNMQVPEPPPPAPIPMVAPIAPVAQEVPGVSLPPGLVGEVAQYIYQTTIRPIPEISLAAALAVVSGVCGRSYNISGSGLNQYIVVLAKTGSGKEGAASGIDNLIAAVRPQVPMVDQFIGPAKFASGQGLVRVLDASPCFVSVLGEFGLTLQSMCDPRAHPSLQALKQVLLDIYAKSGWNKVIRSTAYSDQEKNTKIVQAPNVTILGESTPETFFDGLDVHHIAEGLIPRFSIIEYNGPRPPRNRNANVPPSQQLVNRFGELVAVSLTTSNNGTCANVQMDSPSLQMMDAFDAKADGLINSAGTDVEMQLWNRAHLKALKLAALIAVGCNPHAPVVTQDIAQWAIDFVERDVQAISTRFKTGEVGVGDHRHEMDIRRAIEMYLSMNAHQRASYKSPKSLLEQPVVPFHYLRRKLRLLSAFKNDRRGVARALEESLRDMVKAEVIRLVPPQQALEKFGVTSELYVKGPTW